jgi:hypothetical protein
MREGRPMVVGKVFFEVEGSVRHDCWVCLLIGDRESARFASEADARAALEEVRLTGREYRLVRVTREVVGPA